MKIRNFLLNLQENKFIDPIIILLIIIISSLIIFNNLGSSIVYSWDEARNAETALEIIKTNDWIVMKYGGEPDLWSVKPPLNQWLIAISFKIFGVNEFALRFWSAIAGIGTIVLVYLFGAEIKSRFIRLLSPIILLTTSNYIGWHGVRSGDFDVLMTFFIILSLYFFYLNQKYKEDLFLIGTFAASAFAALVKGVVGLFPLVIIFIYLLYFRSLKDVIFKKETCYGMISFFIITLPWFILRIFWGREFLVTMFSYDLITRFSSTIEGHFGNNYPLYYTYVLGNGLGNAWFFLLIAALIFSVYQFFKKEKLISLVLIWFSSVFIVFNLTQTKLPHYIIPVYPAASILIAYFIDHVNNYTKLIKIKKTFLKFLFISIKILSVLFLLLLVAAYFSKAVKLTNEENKDLFVDFIKASKEGFQDINNLYVPSTTSQSHFFYFSSFIKENVIKYENFQEVEALTGDGLIIFGDYTFDNNDFGLVNKTNEIAFFRKK